MAIQYTTNNDEVKVYNNRGTDVGNIKDKGTVLKVSGQIVSIPNKRGQCYPISSPKSGFVKIADVTEKVIPDPSPGTPPPPPVPVPTGTFYRYKDDVELYGMARKVVNPNHPGWKNTPDDEISTLKGAPAVMVLLDTSMPINDAWQSFLIKINPGMLRSHISALLGDKKAFCNGQQNGFNDTVPHANFILGENLSTSLPKFDKCRTCVRSIFKGVVDGNELIPDMLDGSKPPAEGVIPASHPWLFFTANNINRYGDVYPFPNGAIYSWTPDPIRPYTFLPHVVEFVGGNNPVRIPMNKLIPVDRWVSPYIER